ncbi:AAA family ATPase [Desmospora activa]|uniref:Pilus assembly protein CpaE n=1 Tax=Desmospora activa DSM 45169 TaxID=1121389 RepID=A0A2T4Z1W9_9BACL|nr:AAA family ATPase [Desmospora activa]PTM54777.1 pilus assembly protein CpaE [Desmospora activa DSM 45169]
MTTTHHKLLIVSEDKHQTEDISSRVATIFSEIHSLKPVEVRKEISRLKPDIVVLHEQKNANSIQLIPYISKEVSGALIVYLTEQKDPLRTRDLNRAGAFDILFLPDEIQALEDVLGRAVQAFEKSQEDKDDFTSNWAKGKVMAFYSGKGGQGKSLVTSTLAQTIGLDSNSSVLLVDLNLQYGGVETILQLTNERNIYDLDPVLQELNDNHIRSVTVVEPKSQIEVLVSPVNAEVAELVTEEHVERLLRTARLYYDYILVDLPSEMTPISYTVLEEADQIGCVLVPDMLSMTVLNSVLDLFSKLGIDPANRLNIILNRMSRETELSQKDVAKHFPFPVIASLREDSKRIQRILNEGKLIRTSRNERGLPLFGRDIQKLARWLLTMDSMKSA